MDDQRHFSSGVTLRDIARKLGLSHVTVSLALRDHPKIPAARRRQIQQTALEMGYLPNSMAAALSRYKRDAKDATAPARLAWLDLWQDSEPTSGEFGAYWRSASSEAMRLGYQLVELKRPHGMSLPNLEKFLMAQEIVGILIPPRPPSAKGSTASDDFLWQRFPSVGLGRFTETARVHLLTSSDMDNAVTAFSQVWAKGYRRIGLVLKSLTHGAALSAAGFLEARSRCMNAPILSTLVLPESTAIKTQACIDAWLRRHRPEALLVEDLTLFEQLTTHSNAFAGMPFALLDVPRREQNLYSGIDRNVEEIGCAAVTTLISQINEHASGSPFILRHILIEGTWVDGPSLPVRA